MPLDSRPRSISGNLALDMECSCRHCGQALTGQNRCCFCSIPQTDLSLVSITGGPSAFDQGFFRRKGLKGDKLMQEFLSQVQALQEEKPDNFLAEQYSFN